MREPIMAKTKRERNQKLRLGARRKNETGIRQVGYQFDSNFKYKSTLYKAAIELECHKCCKRIKVNESFWRSSWPIGRFECLRCRPVAKY
jgi:hypothetical protein